MFDFNTEAQMQSENFHMHYDVETGEIKGFYLASIHGENIPEPTIEITPKKHEFYMQNNGKYKLNSITLEDELKLMPDPIPQESSEVEKLRRELLETKLALAEIYEGVGA